MGTYSHLALIASAMALALSTPQSASAQEASIWQISAAENNQTCKIQRLPQSPETALFEIKDQNGCSSVHPGLATAISWVEDDEGNVQFVDAGDRVVATFAEGELDGFESVYPSYPMMIIEPLR